MSFYAGLILKNFVAMGTDRMMVWEELSQKTLGKRFCKINESTVFLLAGNMIFSEIILEVLKREFISESPINLQKFKDFGKILAETLSPVYAKIKSRNIKILEEKGLPIDGENVDTILGGISSEGIPYLIHIGDENNFVPEIYDSKYTSLTFNHEENVLKKVSKIIGDYFKSISGKSDYRQKSLAKNTLSDVIKFVAKRDENVSEGGDLILLDRNGVEIFEF